MPPADTEPNLYPNPADTELCQVCVDRTLPDGSPFVDSGGYGCASYADNNWCSEYGGGYPNQGMIADAACCACGGGGNFTSLRPTNVPPGLGERRSRELLGSGPTSAPTTPAPTPQQTCTFSNRTDCSGAFSAHGDGTCRCDQSSARRAHPFCGRALCKLYQALGACVHPRGL